MRSGFVSLVPNVPTTTEAGMPEYKVDSWLGIFVQAKTPASIVARLNSEINLALASPDIVAKILQIGGDPAKSSVAEFTKLYRSETERWKDVVVRANVKVD